MASGDHRRGKEPAVEEEEVEDKFPEGMRVLVVDDDTVCLRVLEILLGLCKYQPTMVTHAMTALKMLREGGPDQFDLVITDLHMPDMDGFKLLEQIGLEMDLPVIMLSVNGEKDTIYKGIEHGACDYLVKPVNINQLKNIWQHVVRKNQGAMSDNNSDDSDDADQRVVQPVIAEGEQGGSKSKNCSKKKKMDGDNFDENKESTSVPTTRKKSRISWTGELHTKFIEVVNQLGVDKAVPKAILRMMNVEYLTRDSVASHLQKYRMYLKRFNDDPRKSYPREGPKNSSCYMDMGQPGTLCYMDTNHPSGYNNLSAPPSTLGPHGLPAQPTNWTVGTVGNGGTMSGHAVPWLPDTMLDAYPPSHSRKTYSSVLREKLLEASSLVPSSHPGNSSFVGMPNDGQLEHVNQFSVQPPELISPFSGSMYTAPSVIGAPCNDQLLFHVGSSSDPWQNMASSSFPNHMVGAPLLPSSRVNMSQINQLPGFVASPCQMSMQNEQQNQMEGNINNYTSMGGFSEQMTPLFNRASNMSPVQMINDNFPPMTQMMVNGGDTSSPLPNFQTGSFVTPPAQMVNDGLPELQDSSVMPTEMLNGGDASSIPPVQEGPANQQAVDEHPTYSDEFLQNIFDSMPQQDLDGDFFD